MVSKGFKGEMLLDMAWDTEVSVPGVSVGGGRLAQVQTLIILLI